MLRASRNPSQTRGESMTPASHAAALRLVGRRSPAKPADVRRVANTVFFVNFVFFVIFVVRQA